MTTQPEALRLADWLEDQYDPTHNQAQAAAELRRLYAENEALKSDLRMEQTISFRVQMQSYAAQRDVLLNAVRFLLSNPDNRISRADLNAALAAIAKVEENP